MRVNEYFLEHMLTLDMKGIHKVSWPPEERLNLLFQCNFQALNFILSHSTMYHLKKKVKLIVSKPGKM